MYKIFKFQYLHFGILISFSFHAICIYFLFLYISHNLLIPIILLIFS